MPASDETLDAKVEKMVHVSHVILGSVSRSAMRRLAMIHESDMAVVVLELHRRLEAANEKLKEMGA